MEIEYWDAYLKTQSKKRVALFNAALENFGGEIKDSYEQKYFTGKQVWHNPIYHKITLPKGQRWNFILACKCQVILERPPRIGVPDLNNRHPRRGENFNFNHSRRNVRVFSFRPNCEPYVRDFNSGRIVEGGENVHSVLYEGRMDLLK